MSKIGAGSVIIHSQAASQIQIAHGRSFLYQLCVNPGSLQNSRPYIPDIWYLGTKVVMEHFKAVQHIFLF